MTSLINKHRLTVVSNSQGKDLTKFIGYENHGKYTIYGFCQPGAPIQHIIQSVTGSVDFTTLSKRLEEQTTSHSKHAQIRKYFLQRHHKIHRKTDVGL